MRLSILTLTSIGVMLASSPLAAQNINSIQTRMDRLEREMQTLSRSVFKGDVPPPAISSSGGGVDAQQAAQMEVRMNQIEEQMRRLTGTVEENSYRLRQLSEKLENTGNVGNTNSQYQNDSGMIGGESPAGPTSLTNDSGSNDSPYQLGTLNDNGGGSMSPAKMYDQAFSYLQRNDYASAQSTFQDFIQQYPDHSLAANAKYWLGETYYARGDYQESSRAFARAFKDHPDGQKAPDTLLKLAMSLKQQDMGNEACLTLAELKNRFPNAPASVMSKATEEQEAYGCN